MVDCVGADDPVRPVGERSIADRADTPRALVPLRSTALVVGPYKAGVGGLVHIGRRATARVAPTERVPGVRRVSVGRV